MRQTPYQHADQQRLPVFGPGVGTGSGRVVGKQRIPSRNCTRSIGALTGLVVLGMCCLLLGGPTASLLHAEVPPLTMTLSIGAQSFPVGDPVPLQVVVANETSDPVITRVGFLAQQFELTLRCQAPNGQEIRAKFLGVTIEPGPEAANIFVEIIPPGQEDPNVLDDATFYYNFSQVGHYTCVARVPLEIFTQSSIDAETGQLVAPADDPGRMGFDPFSSNGIAFDIVDPTAPTGEGVIIEAEVQQMHVGVGNTPGVARVALNRVPVHLFRQADIPQSFQPINFKVYELIATNVTPLQTAFTDSQGTTAFNPFPQDDYLVIADVSGSPDFKHLGKQVEADHEGWATGGPIEVKLRVIQKGDKKKVAGKTTRLKGSDLLIVEPEFVTWGSDQELYPFVFESVGDWSVTTSVAPPEGFVADQDELEAIVVNDIQAVQFTIIDEGSQWKETKVTFDVKHKKKKTKIKHDIGVKLNEVLARLKGLPVWGHTDAPGVFKGLTKLSEAPGLNP